ncbi:hypothetical protein [Ottowia sp. SB7-C50]|uniref:hypothetical protein n=1 Tax=Ottowia sp. SB7-C50 TaxID=3081231 RepID=UPI00295318DF|nr:hypothetical protein [Ottowia sp. SB7-C50]WOP16184.1 hypothetical protein R0D99_03820 [Ottowia sp. SB7-C50]
MATNTYSIGSHHSADFQDTVPYAPQRTARPNRDSAPASVPRWLSPDRAVLYVALAALVALLLAGIASVAQAQVRKGDEFRFAQQSPTPSGATLYATNGGAAVADLGPVAALSR